LALPSPVIVSLPGPPVIRSIVEKPSRELAAPLSSALPLVRALLVTLTWWCGRCPRSRPTWWHRLPWRGKIQSYIR